MARQLLVFIGFLAVIGGCATGRRALERGQYYEAVTQAIDRLKRNPDQKQALATLKEGYPLAVRYYKDRIKVDDASGDVFRYERIMESFATLNALYDELNRCPACLKVITNARSYSRQYETVRKQAAQARYEAGMSSMEMNNRERSKDAYFHFDRADQLLPGFMDARERRELAREAATLKVIIDVAPVNARRYELSNDYFANKIYQFAHEAPINEFVRFYTPKEADRLKVKDPDQIAVFQFDDFVVGETHTSRDTETVTRDSVKTGTVKVNGETLPVYSTVEAKVSRFTRTVVSRGVVDMRIFDARTERLLAQEKLPGEFAWSTEWGVFQGDERALGDKDIDLCEYEEAWPPAPQQMFVEFCRPIYDQATRQLRRHFQRY